MAKAIAFNSNSMQSNNIITAIIDYHSAPEKTIKMMAIANANKSKTTSANITGGKMIKVSGTLIADSISAMDDLEDTFKGYFTGIDKNLDIGHSSGTRRFIATASEPNIDRRGDLNWANWDITFNCSTPFGIDIASTSLTSGSAVTTPTAVMPITLGGSAEYQYPIITVTIVSGTQMTGQTVSIGNNANGMVCSITRAWVAGDVISIDPWLQLVTVNGIEVPFTGSVPIFEKGAGNFTYADTFLTRSFNYSAYHFRYWA